MTEKKSAYAVIRPIRHQYNGNIFQVETFDSEGRMMSLCNTCGTLEEAEQFCKNCKIKDVRKEFC